MEDLASYGRVALNRGYAPCETGLVKTLKELLIKRLALVGTENGESYFDAEMNARLVYDSKWYYRAMYYGDSASWNLRDTHVCNAHAAAQGENRGEGRSLGAQLTCWECTSCSESPE